MRAHEFPGLLFNTIHKAVGEPEVKRIERYLNSDLSYFILPDTEGEPFAHIGLCDGIPLSGPATQFNLWGYKIKKYETEPNDDELDDPILQIWGGAMRGGVWAYGQGHLINEGIIVRPFGEFMFRGLSLRDPLVALASQIIILAHDLQKDTPMKPLQYWEAFRNPARDYSKP